MKSLRLAIVGLSATLVFASPHCLAQGTEKPAELKFQFPSMSNLPPHRVVKITTAGEMTLVSAGQGNGEAGYVEGYYFLFPMDKDAKGFARVLVTDVDADSLTAKLAREAADMFPEGTFVRLIRPLSATTKQMKAVPDLVRFATDQPKGNEREMAARDPANRARSVNNMKQIGLAMHNFHSANDVLPPAILRSPDGKPMASWRVLILPYLGEAALYNQYDFNEPWDSEKNRKLLDKMPAIYRDPVYGNDKDHFTNYAVLVGENTLFSSEGVKMKKLGEIAIDPKTEGAVGFAQVLDGTSNTICVVPVSPDRKIPWTKPEDIVFDENFPPVGSPKGIAAPYETEGQKVAPVLLMDGSVHTLSIKVQKPTLDALCTRNGGEVIGADAFLAAPHPGQAAMTMTIKIDGNKATATMH